MTRPATLNLIRHEANFVPGTGPGTGWQNVFNTNLLHDWAGRVTSITHDRATDIVHTYGYDNASRITSFNTAGSWAATRNYGYDDAGQLTSKTGVGVACGLPADSLYTHRRHSATASSLATIPKSTLIFRPSRMWPRARVSHHS